MRTNFHHHLLMQIEMLRGDISHEELSKRLGEITERSLARYAAGNVWAKSEDTDLPRDHSVPFKSDARLVKNLNAGLRFFAQQQFNRLELEESAVRCC
jgi:hypothetical protein